MKNAVIIGGGSWGTALAMVLTDNNVNTVVWTNDEITTEEVNQKHTNEKYLKGIILPEKLKFTTDISVVDNADIIVSALPSKVTVQVLDQYKQHFNENQILVNVSKGFEPQTGECLSVSIQKTLPCKFATLSGPSHAEEVAQRMATALVACSANIEIAKAIQQTFSNEYIRVYTNTDVIGAELGGALKNIIALATGIAEGVGLGDNARAAIMTRSMMEITSYGTYRGAKAETFYGLTGVGDLIVTCGSMHSRNRRAGIALGQGKSMEEVSNEIGMVIEGIEALKVVYSHSEKFNIDMPFVHELYDVLFNGKSPKESIVDLMKRDYKSE